MLVEPLRMLVKGIRLCCDDDVESDASCLKETSGRHAPFPFIDQ